MLHSGKCFELKLKRRVLFCFLIVLDLRVPKIFIVYASATLLTQIFFTLVNYDTTCRSSKCSCFRISIIISAVIAIVKFGFVLSFEENEVLRLISVHSFFPFLMGIIMNEMIPFSSEYGYK